MKVALRILILCLCTTGMSQAALVSWSSMGILPNSAAADDEILNLGNTELAFCSSIASSTTYTVNGVTFIEGTGPTDGVYATLGNWAGSGGDFTYSTKSWSTDLKGILNDRIGYSNMGVSTATMTLNGLTVGKEYHVQLLWAANFGAARSMQITSGGVSTGVFDFTTAGVGDGYYTATFTADATTQAFNFTASNGCRAELYAVNVQTVPEPATMVLISLGMGALLAKRRSR